MNFQSNRIVIDWDEIDAVGPRCKITLPATGMLWPARPTGLLAEVVGPFLRDRERYRRVLLDNIIAQMSPTGHHQTIVHRFDGGEKPRLFWSTITTTEEEGS